MRTIIAAAAALTLALTMGLGFASPAPADTIKVAVVPNFVDAAREIAALFKEKTGHDALLLTGSTGGLFSQITQAAPFDVFLSADRERPKAAIAAGFAVPGTQFTYAIGTLVLWSRTIDVADGAAALKAGRFHRLAITNPTVGPNGAAAIEAMKALGVYEAIEPKLVRGNTIAQVFQFIETRNADLGFIALSQLRAVSGGSRWIVPASLHAPIEQDAVLLEKAAHNEAAKAFLAFLKGPEARAVIETYGFASP